MAIEKTRRSNRNPSYKNRAYVTVTVNTQTGAHNHKATVHRVGDLIAYIARETVIYVSPSIDFSDTSSKAFKRQIKAIAAAVTQ